MTTKRSASATASRPVDISAGRSRIDCERLPGRLGGDKAADIDEIIRDDPKADPTFHAVVAAITATLEAMSTLADADAPLASGTPSLSDCGTIASSAHACGLHSCCRGL